MHKPDEQTVLLEKIGSHQDLTAAYKSSRGEHGFAVKGEINQKRVFFDDLPAGQCRRDAAAVARIDVAAQSLRKFQVPIEGACRLWRTSLDRQ